MGCGILSESWHCQMFFLCWSPSLNHLWHPKACLHFWYIVPVWLGDATNCSVPGRLIHYPAASLSGFCKKGKSHDGDGDHWRRLRELHHFLAGVGCMVIPFYFLPLLLPSNPVLFSGERKGYSCPQLLYTLIYLVSSPLPKTYSHPLALGAVSTLTAAGD